MLVRRHVLHSDGFVLLALSLCAAALGVLNTEYSGTWFPVASLSLPVLVGGFLLSVRSLLLLYVVVTAVGDIRVLPWQPQRGSVLRRVRDRRGRAALRPEPWSAGRSGHPR